MGAKKREVVSVLETIYQGLADSLGVELDESTRSRMRATAARLDAERAAAGQPGWYGAVVRGGAQ